MIELIAIAVPVAALATMLLLVSRGTVAPGEGGIVALLIAVLFLAGSIHPVVTMGPLGFWDEHLSDSWGLQIWVDLVLALSASLFLLMPRAKAAGISPLPWIILTFLSGSIGLFFFLGRVLLAEKGAVSKGRVVAEEGLEPPTRGL